ncbi:unnamed protein product [Calicophoron daubneyi]|uniref:P-type domain-containing protein n=1 Tax=Calicophoron daubneyi TaxID=300641 RepID=A0AAV2TK38_CALDB
MVSLVLSGWIAVVLAGYLSSVNAFVGSAECDAISTNGRVDCYPHEGASEEKCVHRGCCWSAKNTNDPDMPMCFFPRGYPAYSVTSVKSTDRGYYADLKKSRLDYIADEFAEVRAEIRHETKTRLRIRITAPAKGNRWEPPIPLGPQDANPPENTDYDVQLDKSPFGLTIRRNDQSKEVLLDSSGLLAPSLIFADQFLQITFKLSTYRGYFPGEVQTSFPHPLNRWMRVGLWARDSAPSDERNLYGVHNFFMGLNHDGTSFGLFLLNSNAQEIALTPLPAITYRSIGGILDFFVFTGPKPADVIAQYYDLIGHPPVPPYWSLGFHLCRYGYKTLNDVKEVLERNLNAEIPIDAQWVDIDYMDARKDWTVSEKRFGGLGKFVSEELHNKYGLRSVLIVDPAISSKSGADYLPYSSGLKLGVFINDSRTHQPLTGSVWPGETVFPDFSHPNAEKWWYDSASRFHDNVPFDGIWIDMNEPASFNAGSTTGCLPDSPLDNPPFVPQIRDNSLFSKTVCPSALHYDTTHYNRHNLYGYDHARVTRHVLERIFPGKRSFILTRSSFAGSGRYTAHWTGDVYTTWDDLKKSTSQIINFNRFGIPMVGADICGFVGDTTEELCVRWSQVGAFYPFSRSHTDLATIPQDPAVWSPNATAAIRDALKLRYFLLPYFYSLFFRAHLNGTTVVRALADEFPEDLSTHTVNSQFMLGSCVLVTPVLTEGRSAVDGYVPAGEWINLSTGKRERSRGEQKYFDAPLSVIPVLVRGGCVLPLQVSPETTTFGRKKGLGLFVVLSEVDDGSERAVNAAAASGELFWDDGESDPLVYVNVQFAVKERRLTIHPSLSSASAAEHLDPREIALKFILIIGITKSPREVLYKGRSLQFVFHQELHTVRITCPAELTIVEKSEITWEFQ